MNTLFDRLWKHRFVRALVWGFGSVVTVYLLLCAWVNYTGARRWADAQALLLREGETIDFRKVAPEPLAESANFCAISALKDLALAVDESSGSKELMAKRKRLEDAALPKGKDNKSTSRPSLISGAAHGSAIDLPSWAEWLRKDGTLSVPDTGDAARDVLTALSKHDALYSELAAGLDRPGAQWTPEWKTRPLPDLLVVVPLPQYQAQGQLVPNLVLRSAAAAQAGDAAKAQESLLILLKLAQASLQDPCVIGFHISAYEALQGCGMVWELCEAHAGSVEDFRRLEQALQALDFHAGLLQAYRGELASLVNYVQWAKRSRDSKMFSGMGGTEPSEISKLGMALMVSSIPRGWFDANAATIAELDFEYMIKPLRDGGMRTVGRDDEKYGNLLKQRAARYQLDSIFACMTIPAVGAASQRAVYTQCLVDQALVACALERYRLEQGNYPDTLAGLKLADGKPLPNDLLSGTSMGYRKTTGGRYALWSVGLDRKDDGGKRTLDKKNPENTRFHDSKYVGDWVWDYPAK